MEQRIKDQLFSKVPVDVQIEEEYALSGQYTPEALLREYRDSIILELKERSILASNMFAQAKIHYEDGNVVCLGQHHPGTERTKHPCIQYVRTGEDPL